MEDIMNYPYNGWENKFTWLMHLHLSNEERLMDEITHLVRALFTPVGTRTWRPTPSHGWEDWKGFQKMASAHCATFFFFIRLLR